MTASGNPHGWFEVAGQSEQTFCLCGFGVGTSGCIGRGQGATWDTSQGDDQYLEAITPRGFVQASELSLEMRARHSVLEHMGDGGSRDHQRFSLLICCARLCRCELVDEGAAVSAEGMRGMVVHAIVLRPLPDVTIFAVHRPI